MNGPHTFHGKSDGNEQGEHLLRRPCCQLHQTAQLRCRIDDQKELTPKPHTGVHGEEVVAQGFRYPVDHFDVNCQRDSGEQNDHGLAAECGEENATDCLEKK